MQVNCTRLPVLKIIGVIMPRPTSKTDLLTAIKKERGALDQLLKDLTDDQLLSPDIVGSWSVKDVLAH